MLAFIAFIANSAVEMRIGFALMGAALKMGQVIRGAMRRGPSATPTAADAPPADPGETPPRL